MARSEGEPGMEVAIHQDPEENIDRLYASMAAIAKIGPEHATSVILKTRHWIINFIQGEREKIGDTVNKIPPQLTEGDMFKEENAIMYAGILTTHLREMIGRGGTPLPDKALEVVGVFSKWVREKYNNGEENR